MKALLLTTVVALATEGLRHHHQKNNHREADKVADAHNHAEAKHMHQRHEERLRMKIEDILLEDILLEAATNQIMKRELRLRQDNPPICYDDTDGACAVDEFCRYLYDDSHFGYCEKCNVTCSPEEVCMKNPDDSHTGYCASSRLPP